MYQKERLDGILHIVEKYGYVTVKYLVSELHYSNATINRDLNALEEQKLIKRTYGGVELAVKKETVLPFRYHQMKGEKMKICKAAAELVNDGDSIFIDASTTTEYMMRFLTEKKNITVITNNMAIVTYLSEHNIRVICLGGEVKEPPCMLDGAVTVENAMRYHVDKLFFATGYVSEEGKIGAGEAYYLLQRVMSENADEVYYLADHEKLERSIQVRRVIMDLSKVKGVITDFDFPEKTKKKYPQTQFIKV